MKKIINRVPFVTALLVVVFSAFSLVVKAEDGNGKPAPTTGELKFIGNLDENPVFQLSLNNTETNEYIITIRDSYGDALYSDKVKGTNITRKFLVNTEEINIDDTLRIEVKCISKKTVEVYEINRNKRMIEELVVNKIK